MRAVSHLFNTVLSASRFPHGEVPGAGHKKKGKKKENKPKTKPKKTPKPKHQHLPLNPTAILKPQISFRCKNAQYIWL